MRASKNELPLMLEAGPASIRGADWGDLRLSVVSVPAGRTSRLCSKACPTTAARVPTEVMS
jgi:hypothetical protein